ncbi:unnamed protein product [Zymoseptoria tritici ST99CH_3D7]|uniref:AB hydrolase-1 domain-containing protein n=1 Tax=Zymoseptoria tritici (strain ST99CH_3D7) TaxID=1276538 RepID=A0A1X7RVT2_ZYMT9|nr:unnamed protein product [Zymoseptoria tritici ST99CH_3D7]
MERIKSILDRIVHSRFNCFTHRPTNPAPTTSLPISKSPVSSSSGSESLPRPKTTLIIAHGAFQSQLHYQTYIDAIRSSTTIDHVLIPAQTAAGPDPPADCFVRDVFTLRTAILDELSSGHNVLLMAHSYGGIPCCEALVDLTSEIRAISRDGTPSGRILGIVFVSAFVVDQGQNLINCHDFGRAAWVGSDGPLCFVIDPLPNLYNLLLPTDTPLANHLTSNLVPQSSASFVAPLMRATWKEYPCVYIRCTKDQAMTNNMQDFFIERLRAGKKGGSAVTVKELEADHMPFASVPVALAKMTEGIVDELRKGV